MTTLTSKGQVTIPKPIRDALQLHAGMTVSFAVNAAREVVIRPAAPARKRRAADRFDAVRGKADIRWRTDELMRLLRAEE